MPNPDPGTPLDGGEARGILDRLLSDLPGVVYRCRNDRDWTVLAVTANVEELTGYAPDELIRNRRIAFADLIHPDDREEVRERVQACVDVGKPFRLTYRIETQGGGERWVLEQGHAVPVTDDEDGLVLTGYIQDVTGPLGSRLVSLEDELAAARRQRGYVELLQAVTAMANEERTLDAALRRAVPEICRALDFAVGHVFLPGGESGPGLRSSEIWHASDEVEGLEAFREATDSSTRDPDQGLPGRVMETGTSEWVEDIRADPEFYGAGAEDARPLRSAVATPLLSHEESLGALEFFSLEHREADAEVQGLLEQIGVQLGRVCERERARKERRAGERRFQQLAENIEQVFWMATPEGEILYMSPGLEDLTGGEGELEHKHDLLELVHPDDRAALGELLSRPDRAPYEVEYRIGRPDGETRWIRQRGLPILDDEGRVNRIGGIAEDVTERRRARTEIEETSRLLEQTINSLNEAVLVVDPTGIEGREILEANPAAERIFGWSRDELVGGATEKLHVDRESYEAFAREATPVLRRGEIFRTEFPMRRKDGTIFEAEETVSLLNPAEGLAGGVVSVIRDISEQTKLESQLRQAQKMEAVGQLAGGIAHDFNNLLTVIRSQADFILGELEESGTLAGEIRLIREASDQGARLTRQLLAFSREQILRPRNVDLNETVTGMEQLLRRVLGAAIAIETELDEDLPPVRVDPGQLEQVVLNLAVNARDAMLEGGTLRIATDRERLTSEDLAALPERPGLEPGTKVRLTIADTGVGMDEETLGRIFEPFFTTKPGKEGTGLGLATTYGIVKQSGGTIHVESQPGEGATFRIRFPPAEGAREERAPTPAGRPGEATGAVLVVEDDEAVRRVTVRILERAGFDVRAVEAAGEALEILAEDADGVDVLLTDLGLRGMSGRELLERVGERFPGVARVAMSGYAEGSPGASPGMPKEIPETVAFAQKPFSSEELAELVRSRLSGRSG